jgi:hypothetical protein
MIVALPTPELIAGAFKNYAGTGGGSESRKQAQRWRAVDQYRGVDLNQDVARYFPAGVDRQVPFSVQAVAGKIIDARAGVYRETPGRVADARYLERLENLDEIMTHFERLTYLLGSMALLIGTTEDGQLYHEPLIEFEPLFLPQNPEPIGVVYPLHNAGAKREDMEWAVWTDQLHFKLSAGGRIMAPTEDNPDLVNPYGVLPVVFAHRGAAGSSWWRPMARDILDAQTAFNVLGTYLRQAFMLQGAGQPWTDARLDGTQLLNPWEILSLEPGETFSFATAGANLGQLIDTQRAELESVAFAHHLSLKWAGEGRATSGEHQRLLEVELTEAIMSDFARWRLFERTRFEIDSVILQSVGLTVGSEYGVNFVEPHIPMSDSEKRERWEWEYGNGLASKLDYLRELDPDASDDMLRDRLETIARERAEEPTIQQRGELSLADLLGGTA